MDCGRKLKNLKTTQGKRKITKERKENNQYKADWRNLNPGKHELHKEKAWADI